MITKTQLLDHYGTGVALARAAGVTKQAVSQWGEKIPPGCCRAIAEDSGGRWTVHDLRPDFFGPAPGAEQAAA